MYIQSINLLLLHTSSSSLKCDVYMQHVIGIETSITSLYGIGIRTCFRTTSFGIGLVEVEAIVWQLAIGSSSGIGTGIGTGIGH